MLNLNFFNKLRRKFQSPRKKSREETSNDTSPSEKSSRSADPRKTF